MSISTAVSYCGITRDVSQRQGSAPLQFFLMTRTPSGSIRYAPMGESQLLHVIKQAVEALDMLRKERNPQP